MSLLSHIVAFFAATDLLPLLPPILIPSPSSRESRRAASFIDPADRFPQPPRPSPYSTAVGIPQHQTELDCLPSPASRLPTPRPTWHPLRARATKRGDRLIASVVFALQRLPRGFRGQFLLSSLARRLRPDFATRTQTPTEVCASDDCIVTLSAGPCSTDAACSHFFCRNWDDEKGGYNTLDDPALVPAPPIDTRTRQSRSWGPEPEPRPKPKPISKLPPDIHLDGLSTP